MSHTFLRWAVAVVMLLSAIATPAQQQTSGGLIVPRLIRFGGVLKGSAGKPLQGTVGITFALYKDQEGGAALWLETQNVALDASGHYSVLLGATKEEGIPTELFTSGQAQWLGVHVQGEPEQPRVWMVSVPYALKAADAETLGGLPPSAFAPAVKVTTTNSAANPAPAAAASVEALTALTPTGSGITNFLPLWTSSSTLSSSVASQIGGNLGLGFSSPLPGSFASRLDINGGAFIRGLLQLPPTGSATALAGKNSNALDLVASSFSTVISQPLNQRFRWQAEPVSNNSSSPSGKLNLLYGIGSSTPTETGLSISNVGALTVLGMTLPPIGTASSTHTAGFNSRALDLLASAWNTSGTPSAISEHFRWQAEPASSNTTAPSGTLNLLFAPGNAAPAETGFKISSKGLITFAPGQSFPPAAGIVRSVGLSAPASDFNVSGSPVTGSGTLGLAWKVAPSSANNANAIVKRDANGSFNAANISAVTVSAGNSTTDIGIEGAGNSAGLEGFGTGGSTSSGVFGIGPIGVWGEGGSGGMGVLGAVDQGYGVYARVNSSISGTFGVAILGENFSPQGGINGFGPDGTDGISHNAAGSGVAGLNDAGGSGVFGQVTNGGTAGDFFGEVDVNGTLKKTGGSFIIDHPLDPANKYLSHSFVESPDMMNIYNGNVITDSKGLAVVQLPEWFEALNRDFRYQLTVIGQFAQAIVASEIVNRTFTIKTDKPNVKVSWQVTGIRQDAWANAHRIPVEEAKPPRERGYYLHPELFGAPIEKSVIGLRHPSIVAFSKRAPGSQGKTTETSALKK